MSQLAYILEDEKICWKVKIILSRSCWKRYGSIWSIGKLFNKEDALNEAPSYLLNHYLDKSMLEPCKNNLINYILNLNGFYAFIIVASDNIYLVADAVRSIPIFYSYNSSELIITDDPYEYFKEIKANDIDNKNLLELLISGIVTGNKTVIKGLYQVEAGQIVDINLLNQDIKVFNYKYLFPENNNDEIDLIKYYKKLDETLEKVFLRVKKISNGKIILLPLSGGLDSRLIALWLKIKGIKNVICFCYGSNNSPEKDVSNIVAKSLGYEWIFVEYSKEKIRELNSNELFNSYLLYSHKYSSLPNIQDFVACNEISKIISKNDVLYMPGHTGNFVAGSEIPFNLINKRDFSESAKTIFKRYFSLFNLNSINYVYKNLCLDPIKTKYEFIKNIENSLSKAICGKEKENYENLSVSLFEYWSWREHHAKFIVNWIRVAEYFGFEWYMPLWDWDYVQLWEGMPLGLRKNRFLLRCYINYIQDRLGIKLSKKILTMNDIKKEIICDLSELLNYFLREPEFIEKLKDNINFFFRKSEYDKHIFNWYYLFDKKLFNEVIKTAGRKWNINTFIALYLFNILYKNIFEYKANLIKEYK